MLTRFSLCSSLSFRSGRLACVLARGSVGPLMGARFGVRLAPLLFGLVFGRSLLVSFS